MSYGVSIEFKDVYIYSVNMDSCLAAVNAMWDEQGRPVYPASGSGTKREGGKKITVKWYAHFEKPEFGFSSLSHALGAWGLVTRKGRLGLELVGFYPLHWYEDREELFKVIAPFVHTGGEMVCTGEDGEKWKYTFSSEGLTVWDGVLAWEKREKKP